METCISAPVISFVKMMMDLISSPSDICIVFGICDYLGKINEIDIESRRNNASVVLTPRVSETATLSRLHAADKFSSCGQTAEGNFSARASPFEITWHADSERSTAQGNLRLFPNQQTGKAVVERANEKTDTELLRLWRIADYRELLNIGDFIHTRLARGSGGMLSILCGEADKLTKFERWSITSKGRSKKQIFSTKKEARALML